MGLAKLKTKRSVEDYLDGEKDAAVRHEFVDGEVYSMAGASDRHHRICLNLITKLDVHLDGSECDAFITDIKLKVNENTFYYPDIFVACDKNPKSPFYREEPTLIIEVASPSTWQIDRREKLRAYQQMSGVVEYIVIEQTKMHIELLRRQPNGSWITYFYNDNDQDVEIEFQSVGLKTNLGEIYRRVNFDEIAPEIFE
ncbi:MAG: Uma2 family endonuclease [Pyrinomonadaceae bacterium]